MRILKEKDVRLTREIKHFEPISKYFIVPEGDNKEIQYFEGLISHREDLKISSLIEVVLLKNDETEFGQSHPKQKLTNFEKTIDKNNILISKEIDKVYFVIDRDPQNFKKDQFDEFKSKCKEKEYYICLSNPTFEIFILMHDDRILSINKKDLLENRKDRKKGSKRFLEKKISEFFGFKKTNINFDILLNKIPNAVKNEKHFCENLDSLKDELGSNVGLLISELINRKIN